MIHRWNDQREPSPAAAYTEHQRRRTLTISLLATLAAAGGIALVNLGLGDAHIDIVLLLLAALCLPALWLNTRGYFLPAGLLVSGAALLVALYSLYVGAGLHDIAVVAYPIIILLGGLLFGKRALPLFAGAGVLSLIFIGWLEISGRLVTPQPADPFDVLTLLILIATATLLVWVIMDNDERNLARIQQSEATLRAAYDRTLEGWAKALEYRDRETEGHSRRVTDMAERLARALGCGEEELESIRRGAMLHDIGKLAIPDRILRKPGPLEPEEMALMRKHPIFARDMLQQIPFLRDCISIPYSHHERWDGQGYPEGLCGEQIPFEARLFALVDQWEALSSDRPYRPAWPREKIKLYIRENAGTIFDPDLADLFLRLI